MIEPLPGQWVLDEVARRLSCCRWLVSRGLLTPALAWLFAMVTQLHSGVVPVAEQFAATGGLSASRG